MTKKINYYDEEFQKDRPQEALLIGVILKYLEAYENVTKKFIDKFSISKTKKMEAWDIILKIGRGDQCKAKKKKST
jgi:hypothetical protein